MSQKAGKRKKQYQVISQEMRQRLIASINERSLTIKEAAQECQIKFSTAKAILQTFRNEGRIGKKQNRWKQNRAEPSSRIESDDQISQPKNSNSNQFFWKPQLQSQLIEIQPIDVSTLPVKYYDMLGDLNLWANPEARKNSSPAILQDYKIRGSKETPLITRSTAKAMQNVYFILRQVLEQYPNPFNAEMAQARKDQKREDELRSAMEIAKTNARTLTVEYLKSVANPNNISSDDFCFGKYLKK